MPKLATATSAVFDPGLEKATVLRPEQIARLELLRIIYTPNRDAGLTIKLARELEAYVSGGQASGPT